MKKYMETVNAIQWTGYNLIEVIDFTGKSPRFEEWFKSWKEYADYVHSHDNILKLFLGDGSHYEVPVGAWIVKTPDGYCVPSISQFVQKGPSLQEQYEEKMKCWVARDELHGDRSDLYIGECKPRRIGGNTVEWVNFGEFMALPTGMFPDLTYKDDPIEVELIIRPL